MQRALTEGPDGSPVRPLQGALRRTIPLPPALVVRLRHHRARQLKERLKLRAGKWVDARLIFASEMCSVLDRHNVASRGDPAPPVLVVRSLLTGSERLLVPGWLPRWSPDGQWIAYLRDFNPEGYGALWLVRPDGSEAHAATDPGVYSHDALDWSPDSQWLVGTGAVVTLVQPSTGLVVPIGPLGSLHAGAWRP